MSDVEPKPPVPAAASVGNWGRWGQGDQVGALNLITTEKVLRAVGLVRNGRRASLAVVIRRDMPLAKSRVPPLHLMSRDGGDFSLGLKPTPGAVESADDYLVLGTHSGTHIDALSHIWTDGKLFNGYGRESVRSSGAHRLDITNARGVLTRGLLLDIPGTIGRPLNAGERIDPDVLASAADGLNIESGDAVLIRTGWLARHEELGDAWHGRQPGIGIAAAQWLADRDVAIVGSDNLAVECQPWDSAASGIVPVHALLIRQYGVYLIELLNLEQLATEKVREFAFFAAALPIKGGVASPVDPLAVW